MKGFRATVAAMMAAVLLLAPPLALAGEYQDGHTPSNGAAPGSTPISGWSGSANKAVRTDASGILRTTEEYPYQLQNDAFPAADTTNTVINLVLRPLGLGWSVSPFGSRTVTVTRVMKGTPNVLKLYLFGSDDNINYHPIISKDAWVVGDGDSAKIDTLMVRIPAGFQGPNTVKQFKIVLPEEVYPGRYVQIWAMRQDSAYASNAMHVGLTYEGRWK